MILMLFLFSCGELDECAEDYQSCLGVDPSKEVVAICKAALAECRRDARISKSNQSRDAD